MPKMPSVKPKRFVRALERFGFSFDRQRGSHAIFRHSDGRIVVVPMHSSDIPFGTLRGILKDMRISVEELKEVL